MLERRSIRVLAAASMIAIVLRAAPAPAVQDPSLHWHSIETEHFRVNYHDGLEKVALRTAAAAEECHEKLSVVLRHEPKWRTEITISDESDFANGWALTVPFNQIHLWATAPGDMDTLQDYDDWYLGLVMHEYTHILHIDTYGGIAKAINAVFGKIYPPNNAQPRWIIEGFAVFEESDKTTGGRMRSSQWDMMMRAAVLDDDFLPVDVIAIGPLGWPHGTTFYLYGSYFIQWLVERYGEGILADISEDYGKSLLPYGINRTIREITGKTWIELYEEWFEDARLLYGAQAEGIREHGLREGMQITDTGNVDLSPRFSPDGERLALYSWDGHQHGGIWLLDLEAPLDALDSGCRPDDVPPEWDLERLLETTGQGSVVWTPDGEGIVFARSETWRNWYSIHDLFHARVDGSSLMRMTEGGRSRQPDVSPDGALMAYTVNGAGTSKLVVATAGPHPLVIDEVVPEDFGQIYSPRFSPDGRRIAYSRWSEGGYRDIHVLDLDSGETTRITRDRAVDAGPVWDPQGRFLYFVSDRTGISNVHALDLADGSLWQVTNVLTGAFQPDVSPDGTRMVYLGYHSRGYDLYLMDLEPSGWTEAAPPPEGPEADLSWTEDADGLEPGKYNALRTLLPRSWSFMVAQDGYGYSLDLLAAGTDVAGHHSLSATLHTGLEGRGRFGYSLAYSFLQLPVDIALSTSRTVAPRWGFRVDDEWKTWTEVRYGGRLAVTLPFARQDWYMSLTLSYRLAYMMSADPLSTPLDPNAALPHRPDRGWLSGIGLSWWWSNAYGPLYGVSLEQGVSLWASAHADLPEVGSEYRAVSVGYGIAGYLKMPWLRHHVLALRFAGGYAWSDFERRGYYSVGGYPDQDIIMDLVNQVRWASPALRGYPPGVAWGDQYYLLNVEYRFPVVSIFRGPSTAPLTFQRIWIAVFSDTGAAFPSRTWDWDGIMTGVGGEIYLSMTLGYWEGAVFKIGYARGLMDGGINDFYVVMASPF